MLWRGVCVCRSRYAYRLQVIGVLWSELASFAHDAAYERSVCVSSERECVGVCVCVSSVTPRWIFICVSQCSHMEAWHLRHTLREQHLSLSLSLSHTHTHYFSLSVCVCVWESVREFVSVFKIVFLLLKQCFEII